MDAATTDATIDSATMSATTDVATTYSTTINPASSVATMDPAVIDSDSEKSTVTLPKKRFFAEPRYISEITVTDVNTEEKAKKVITFIKQEYEKKCKEMKTLQQKNRRLKKLIVSLQELVAHLKESKLLSEDAADNFMLKNRGPYLKPSDDVCRIYKIAESTIRQYTNKLQTKMIQQLLMNIIYRKLSFSFSNDTMQNHILSQDILDNHKTQLCKRIISLYINIRLFHEAKTMSSNTHYIRQKYTKLILFHNQ
ncbi:uncharacterized protein LOC112589066 isoform X1 [Harpegnathos saltator]|uniref:uncharacterized protein LOC112589066 isoform X1 n=1 Tax=Harpegnathos saltator TaxID=610380 RepID=UPI000DBEDCD2|nr:uncharacterized protein LOC112589066 isoform X1 [Harpegnathos saltator]